MPDRISKANTSFTDMRAQLHRDFDAKGTFADAVRFREGQVNADGTKEPAILRVKSGLWKSQFKKTKLERAQKYAKAANVIKQAINKEFAGNRVGDQAIGDYVFARLDTPNRIDKKALQSIDRLLGDALRKATRGDRNATKGFNIFNGLLNAAQGGADPAANARLGQWKTIVYGHQSLKQAIMKDLVAADPYYAVNDRAMAAIVAEDVLDEAGATTRGLDETTWSRAELALTTPSDQGGHLDDPVATPNLHRQMNILQIVQKSKQSTKQILHLGTKIQSAAQGLSGHPALQRTVGKFAAHSKQVLREYNSIAKGRGMVGPKAWPTYLRMRRNIEMASNILADLPPDQSSAALALRQHMSAMHDMARSLDPGLPLEMRTPLTPPRDMAKVSDLYDFYKPKGGTHDLAKDIAPSKLIYDRTSPKITKYKRMRAHHLHHLAEQRAHPGLFAKLSPKPHSTESLKAAYRSALAAHKAQSTARGNLNDATAMYNTARNTAVLALRNFQDSPSIESLRELDKWATAASACGDRLFNIMDRASTRYASANSPGTVANNASARAGIDSTLKTLGYQRTALQRLTALVTQVNDQYNQRAHLRPDAPRPDHAANGPQPARLQRNIVTIGGDDEDGIQTIGGDAQPQIGIVRDGPAPGNISDPQPVMNTDGLIVDEDDDAPIDPGDTPGQGPEGKIEPGGPGKHSSGNAKKAKAPSSTAPNPPGEKAVPKDLSGVILQLPAQFAPFLDLDAGLVLHGDDVKKIGIALQNFDHEFEKDNFFAPDFLGLLKDLATGKHVELRELGQAMDDVRQRSSKYNTGLQKVADFLLAVKDGVKGQDNDADATPEGQAAMPSTPGDGDTQITAPGSDDEQSVLNDQDIAYIAELAAEHDTIQEQALNVKPVAAPKDAEDFVVGLKKLLAEEEAIMTDLFAENPGAKT